MCFGVKSVKRPSISILIRCTVKIFDKILKINEWYFLTYSVFAKFFQGNSFGFRHHENYKEQLQNHHKGKESKYGPRTYPGKSAGMEEGISQANTQCTELPKAWPEPLKWFGKTSEIKTQITAPWPIAWDAINKKRKIGTAMPSQFKINAAATSDKEII